MITGSPHAPRARFPGKTRRARLALHGIANRKLSVASAALAALIAASAPGIGAEPFIDTPAWTTSPYHGVIDGSGKRIPCRCRYQGSAYRLGDTVCMTTHLGVQLARCDLALNNTSWVPTGTPCTMSGIPLSPRIFSLSPPGRGSG